MKLSGTNLPSLIGHVEAIVADGNDYPGAARALAYALTGAHCQKAAPRIIARLKGFDNLSNTELEELRKSLKLSENGLKNLRDVRLNMSPEDIKSFLLKFQDCLLSDGRVHHANFTDLLIEFLVKHFAPAS